MCACAPVWKCAPTCACVFPGVHMCSHVCSPMSPCVCVCPSVGLCSHVCVCVPLHPHVCMCVPMCACVPVWECAPMRSCVFPCVHVSLCGTMFPHVCSHVCSPTSPCAHVCAQTQVHMPTGAQGDEEAVASTHAGARLSLHPCAEEPDISLSKALQRAPFLLSVGSVGYSHQKSRSQCHKENNNKGSFPRKGLEDNSVQHPV